VSDLRIVTAGRRAHEVVDEVGFEVRAGEILGLVGESGSGKTTVALSLLGYARRGLKIESGAVMLDGTDVLALSPAQLRRFRGARVAYVPQDPSSALNPALKIGTQLREAMQSHPHAVADVERRVDEVLHEVRLAGSAGIDYLSRYPHQLSGGQQQRVALAMAVSCRPSLIVLDEPTTGLDVTTQRHVLDMIRELCAAYGVAAVYVSHDLAVVGGLVSSVAVMYAGRVVEYGPIDQVFGDPVHPYTQRLLAAIPSPERSQVLVGIDGQAPRPGRRPAGCSFAARCEVRIDRCAQDPPITLEAGRTVRCWRAAERALAPSTAAQTVPDRQLGGGAVLELCDITVSYGQTQVLHEVSVRVPEGECLAVVGESGSGKTTLARAAVGLHANFAGRIVYDGQLLGGGARSRTKEQLRRIQYVFQNPYTSLNPRKTIGQIVGQPVEHFFDCSRSERHERVVAALRDVSLSEEFVGRLPHQLSGGERQRAAIARALVVDPDLVVCDEVTSALDVSVQAVIVELLRRLQAQRNLTMIFITHNLALVRSIAQSVVVLDKGVVVDSGPVGEVLTHPSNPYTERLLADVPKVSQFAAPTPAPRRPA
jgi:peptide/nickel transport system ATP-binding protein